MVFVLAHGFLWPVRFLAAGDSFFAIYLVAVTVMIASVTAKDLRERAALEDEGIAIVVVVTLVVVYLVRHI